MVTGRALQWVLLLALAGGCSSRFEVAGGGNDAAVGGKGSGSSPKQTDPKSSEVPEQVTTMTGEAGAADDVAMGGKGNVPGEEPTKGGSPPSPGAYPGHGFIVHEWGTDTIVVGSDGSLQRGLHHEEEDLPDFVYDRIKAATLLGMHSPSVTIKMETPVTYFYSDVPLMVQATVDFPKGILTQWYPSVVGFAPPMAAPLAVLNETPVGYDDPVLNTSFVFKGDTCRTKYTALTGGKLEWGMLSVLARGTDFRDKMPKAALDKFSWSYARDVDSNPVQLPNEELEQFLFYRGLGDFDLPVTVKAAPKGVLSLHNGFTAPIGAVFAINVNEKSGAFNVHAGGIAAQGDSIAQAPDLTDAKPLDAYARDLSDAVTNALDGTGLYHDESVAMVNTWKRQWFRTPGTRLLYVIPQRWTDESIPLTISPKPDAMLRVMLIRVEVITPEQEAADVAAIAAFDTNAPLSREHFAELGRFAEPRLRRALSLQDSSAGQKYLAEIRTANSAVASGE